MKKFEVRLVGDPNCTTVNDEVLAEADTYREAECLAVKHSSAGPWGTAIVDTETGAVDWGWGFGIPVPNPEENV